MNTEANTADGVSGNMVALESFIGTVHHIRRAADQRDWGQVENFRETMIWQLSNLETIRHPFAARVQTILNTHGCHPARVTFQGDRDAHGLFDAKESLYDLIYEALGKTRSNIVPFEKPVTDIPVEGTGELDLAA